MSFWLIVIVALALLVGFFALRRRGPRQDKAAADSTTQVAALRAMRAPSRAEAAAAEVAGVAATEAADAAAAEAAAGAASAAGATASAVNPSAVEPAEALSVRAETLRALHEVAFGITLPPTPPPATAADDAISAQIGRTLTNIVDKPNYAPRRPMQLPKLMRAINDDSASRGELSQIIAGDPALAGNLLRLANSPIYRHSTEAIESLDRAVAMLGIEGLRSMIAAALLQPVFRTSGGSFAQFGEVTWEHSLYAAAAAEADALLVENADPFAAQLLTLMLGLATIVVFTVAQDAFLSQNKAPDGAIIARLIDAHALSVARQIAASWELSERIDAALAEQLEPLATPATPLGRCLRFGEFIGALAVLRARGAIDDQTAHAVLQSAETATGANERIWTRLRPGAQ
jgi:HD-like signal output (HDOD) protein